MNLPAHPELLDRLAQRYAFNVMRGGARRRFAILAQQQAPVRARVQAWQAQAEGLVMLPAPLAVPATLWMRIEAALSLGADAAAGASKPRAGAARAAGAAWRWPWRAIAAGGVFAALASVALFLNAQSELDRTAAALASAQKTVLSQSARLEAQSSESAKLTQALSEAQAARVDALAVLAGEQPSMLLLVTWDRGTQRMKVRRLGSYQEGADRSLQLWTLQGKTAPRSLGLVSASAAQALSVPAEQLLSAELIAVSLEPKGGVPEAGGPTGPVLFKGQMIRTAL